MKLFEWIATNGEKTQYHDLCAQILQKLCKSVIQGQKRKNESDSCENFNKRARSAETLDNEKNCQEGGAGGNTEITENNENDREEDNFDGSDTETTENTKKPLVDVVEKMQAFNKKFNVTELKIIFKINQPESANGFDWLIEAFDKIINEIKIEAGPNDRAVLRFALPELPEVEPIYIGLTPIANLSADNIFERLEMVNQSNSSFFSSEIMEVTAEIVHKYLGKFDKDILFTYLFTYY